MDLYGIVLELQGLLSKEGSEAHLGGFQEILGPGGLPVLEGLSRPGRFRPRRSPLWEKLPGALPGKNPSGLPRPVGKIPGPGSLGLDPPSPPFPGRKGFFQALSCGLKGAFRGALFQIPGQFPELSPALFFELPVPGQSLRGIARGSKTLFQPRQAPGHLPPKRQNPALGLLESFLLLIPASGGIRKDPGQVLEPLPGFAPKPFLPERPPGIRRPRRGREKQETSRQEKGRKCRAKPAPKDPRALFSPLPNPLLSPNAAPRPAESPKPGKPRIHPLPLPSKSFALSQKTPGPRSFPGTARPDPSRILRGFSRRGSSGMMPCGDPASQKKVRPLPRQRARRFLPGRVRKMVGSFEDSRRIPPAGTGAPGECPIDMKTILDKTLPPSQEQMGGIGTATRRGILLSGQGEGNEGL